MTGKKSDRGSESIFLLSPRTQRPEIRIHRFLPLSYANGPGARAVIWVQGCSLGCPGCFNPKTHASGGELTSVDDLFLRIAHLGNTIEGVSVSGGEPLQQYYPILTLLQQVRQETQLSILMFTRLFHLCRGGLMVFCSTTSVKSD